jgi:hypothetical protein
MLNCDPVVAGGFANNPFAAKAADAAIPFTTKWPWRRVMNAVIVYVRHAGLKLKRELNTSFAIRCEHGPGSPWDCELAPAHHPTPRRAVVFPALANVLTDLAWSHRRSHDVFQTGA